MFRCHIIYIYHKQQLPLICIHGLICCLNKCVTRLDVHITTNGCHCMHPQSHILRQVLVLPHSSFGNCKITHRMYQRLKLLVTAVNNSLKTDTGEFSIVIWLECCVSVKQQHVSTLFILLLWSCHQLAVKKATCWPVSGRISSKVYLKSNFVS